MEIKITLNEEDLNILDKALIELPYKDSVGVIDKINEQIHHQLMETEKAELAENEKVDEE